MEPVRIVPLDRAFLQRIDAEEPWTERVAKCVPVLGWIVQSHLWSKRVGPIRRRLFSQLIARPKSTRRTWEGDPQLRAIAQMVCEIAQTEMGWPTDAFIPEDPWDVVFWSYDDGLDLEWAMMKVEEQLGIKFSDEELHGLSFIDMSLGEFVSYLVDAEAARNTAPTAGR